MTDGQAVAGALAGAGAGAATVIMGAHVDALVLGLVAALCVSTWLGSMDKNSKVAAAAVFSALLAGYGSPWLAQYLSVQFPEVKDGIEMLRVPSALLIGGMVPLLFPLVIRFFGSRIGGAA